MLIEKSYLSKYHGGVLKDEFHSQYQGQIQWQGLFGESVST